MAGGEHDGRSVAAGGVESAAAPAALCRAADAALGGGAGAERCLDGGFQRLVSHGGRHAVRSADRRRRVQSVRVVLSHRRAAASAGVRPWFERTFRDVWVAAGAADRQRLALCDDRARASLSHLAVWWLKLGIQLDRIDPGHPEQNGRHERFHLTLQQETTTPPAPTPRQQQARSIGCGANSIRSGRMKRSASNRRRASMCLAPALPRAARGAVVRRDAPGAPRRTDGADQVAAATWSLSAKPCAANRSGWRKPSGAIGPCASCMWNWGASIATRAALRRRGTAGGAGLNDDREDQLWKCRPYGNHRTVSTGTWKSRTEREIPTFPQLICLDADETERNDTESSKVLPMYPV